MATALAVDSPPLILQPRRPSSLLRDFGRFPGRWEVGRPRSNVFSRRSTAFVGVLNPVAVRALMEEEEERDDEEKGMPSVPVRIVAVVGEGSVSPLKNAPWEEVMLHTATRLKWVDEGFNMVVFSDKSVCSNETDHEYLKRELSFSEILIIVAVKDHGSINWLQENSKGMPNILCFESSSDKGNKLGGHLIHNIGADLVSKLTDSVNLGSRSQQSLQVLKTVSDAWERHNADDIRFCLLVVINSYVRPVSTLTNLRAKGLPTLNCMIKNCGEQIFNCLLDENCRKAIQCLNQCSPTDQVCNYRCIASYESPQLEAFSLCVLQKNNCLELDAKIPRKPEIAPMCMFRGEMLTHDIAEDLFIGWLGELEWSWRVIAGQNPAYDQFPCQYQIFYRGKAKSTFWYEPVFQVKTLAGKLVWRRRRYRVRRGNIPGTFYFSVLDNGVVSKEFWTIVDVCDNFSWALFHYSGAAQAAGVSYTGAVLVSPDGAYPSEMDGQRFASALEKCSIKEWELYTVDNCSCTNPPLGIPEGSRLYSKVDPNICMGL